MEQFDLLTHDRQKTGETILRGIEIPEGRFHVVVHLCLFNTKGQLLIQKRSETKQSWSGYWDLTAAGSVQRGETSSQAMTRELKEELGIEYDFEGQRPIMTLTYPAGFDDFFLITLDVEGWEFCDGEVSEARFASEEEVIQMIEEGSMIPWKPELMRLLFQIHKSPQADFFKTDKMGMYGLK